MLTYLKTTRRTRYATDVIDEATLCPQCLCRLRVEARTPHDYDAKGYRLEVREWTGEARECSYCDAPNGVRPTATETNRAHGITVLAVLLCLLLPSFAAAQSLTIPASVFIGINGLDLASTAHVLKSTSGSYEANVLMGQSNAQRIAVKSATTAGVVLLAQLVSRRGHPTAAKALLWSGSALVGVVVAQNARVGQ